MITGILTMQINVNNIVAKIYQPLKLDKPNDIKMGGRACTKSSCNAILIILTMLQYKDLEVVVVRQFQKYHRDSTLKELQIACERLGLKEEVHFKIGTSPFNLTMHNGSKIYFGALESYEQLKGFKPTNSSKFFGIIWFFEIAEFKGDYEMEQTISTFVRGYKPIFRVLYEGNPSHDMYNWTYKWLENKKNDDSYSYSFYTYLDLTDYEKTHWLGQAMLDRIDKMKELTPNIYDHMYLGLPRVLEGAIYIQLPQIKERPEKFDYILLGLDYGQGDATTIVAVGVKGNNYHVFDQYYHKNHITDSRLMTLNAYKKDFGKWLNDMYECEEGTPMTLTVDTQPMTVYTTIVEDNYINLSIKVKKVVKRKTEQDSRSQIQERIDVINYLIATGNLTMTHEMQLTKALSQAVYKSGKRLDNGTSDIDSLDGLEYAIMEEFDYIYKNIL